MYIICHDVIVANSIGSNFVEGQKRMLQRLTLDSSDDSPLHEEKSQDGLTIEITAIEIELDNVRRISLC